MGLQKCLTQCLKDNGSDMFPSVKGPLKENHFERFVDSPVLRSGDYDGATDTLDFRVSNFTLACIMNTLGGAFRDKSVRDRMFACLTKHLIDYEDAIKHSKGELPEGSMLQESPSVIQRNGQLMGSYLSFPILCIANWAVNWQYLDPELKYSRCQKLPMIVIGDYVLLGEE